eukprot:GHVU01116613.1.p1 GENE.GHVU01116613.1~~GHVU01116613.1.p1  ORF type:complete len:147 (-),score=29.58 GHVU01116613.1:79-519(-)
METVSVAGKSLIPDLTPATMLSTWKHLVRSAMRQSAAYKALSTQDDKDLFDQIFLASQKHLRVMAGLTVVLDRKEEGKYRQRQQPTEDDNTMILAECWKVIEDVCGQLDLDKRNDAVDELESFPSRAAEFGSDISKLLLEFGLLQE